MTERQERERIMRAMWAEMDRQCAIGAGEWHTDAETGLMCIKADFDPIAMADALTPKAPPQTPPDAGIGSDGAGDGTYRSAADCPLGSAHGSASTHRSADGIDICDWCGFPADDDATQPGDGGRS